VECGREREDSDRRAVITNVCGVIGGEEPTRGELEGHDEEGTLEEGRVERRTEEEIKHHHVESLSAKDHVRHACMNDGVSSEPGHCDPTV
jgi:hypothetical protein